MLIRRMMVWSTACLENSNSSASIFCRIWSRRRVIANRAPKMAIGIRTQAPVVIKLARRGARGGAIECIATTLTDQHPLQQGGLDRAPGRMTFVLLQLLLRQGEG